MLRTYRASRKQRVRTPRYSFFFLETRGEFCFDETRRCPFPFRDTRLHGARLQLVATATANLEVAARNLLAEPLVIQICSRESQIYSLKLRMLIVNSEALELASSSVDLPTSQWRMLNFLARVPVVQI